MSFKARKMRPGIDTIAIMADHYGLTPVTVREVIRDAGVPVIREDGVKSVLAMVPRQRPGQPVQTKNRTVGWKADGQNGVNLQTTKLTRDAIHAVALWKHQQSLFQDTLNTSDI